MPKITIQLVVFNSKTYLDQVFTSIYNQTVQDFEVIAVICGNVDGSKEYIADNWKAVKIIDPGENLGFAGGHNLAFKEARGEFVQIIGNDLLLEPAYLEEQLKVFSAPEVASSTGKLFGYDFEQNKSKGVLDTTGILLYANGRARDRGQHEKDLGQYDESASVPAVSGAAPMYRKSALEEVGYFDPDFFMYWEDVDLGLRLLHAGYKNVYVPNAVGYHGRGSGSSEKGMQDMKGLKKHRESISLFTRRLNFKNHIFFVLKNFPKLNIGFFLREFLMLGYVLVFETRTLSIFPLLLKQLPGIIAKRKQILRTSKLSAGELEVYFAQDKKAIV